MPALAAGKRRLVTPADPAGVRLQLVGWTCLGLLGCACMVLTAGQLAGGTVRWWLDPSLSISRSGAEAVLYSGMIALTLAWLGLGRLARAELMSPRTVWIVGVLWSVPLFLAAPLFSRDVYSYLAQGTILHLGHNPYHDLPVVLGHLGRPGILHAVDRFWQHTTAPYGPLFLEVVSWIAGLTGSHLVLGAQLVKLLGLVGLVLLAVCVPRLARALGHDPVRATWLAILNPLVLFALVTPGHNDLLMVGLMVAGVTLAVEQRPVLGIVLCALAATVKLPALLAVGFIAVAWARSSPPREALRRLGIGAVVTLVVLAVVTLVAGVGVSWVTSTLFSAPARVKLAITPSSGLACTVYRVLGRACQHSGFLNLQSVFRALAGALTLLIVLELLRRTRPSTLVRYLGLALLALAWGGPAAWPWYFVWGLVLLAALPTARTVAWSVAIVVAGAFVVKPSGILAIPLPSAPWVMLAYLAGLLLAWYSFRPRGRQDPPRAPARSPGPAADALTESPPGSALAK